MRFPAPPGTAAFAVALVGLAVLAGISKALEPPLIPVADTATREGAAVLVEGRLAEVHVGARGFHAVVVDATGRLDVLGRGGTHLRAGDDVRLRGTVSIGTEGYVLSADRADVLVPSPGFVRGVGEVLHAPERFAGAPLAVRGVVRDARLVDAAGGASLILAGDPGAPPPEGAGVVAEGAFTYRPQRGAYELRLHAWRRL